MRRWAKAHPTSAGAGLGGVLITLLAMGITLSILSVKNESLRIANRREQEATQKAEASAVSAKTNAVEAVRQRQRVLGILNTFLVDVQRGLANVPGSARESFVGGQSVRSSSSESRTLATVDKRHDRRGCASGANEIGSR